MASGTVGGHAAGGRRRLRQRPATANSVCGAAAPRRAAAGCTDPNSPSRSARSPTPPVRCCARRPTARAYPARKGHDQFYGYGRVNMVEGRRRGRRRRRRSRPRSRSTSPELVRPGRPRARPASTSAVSVARARRGLHVPRARGRARLLSQRRPAPAGDFAAGARARRAATARRSTASDRRDAGARSTSPTLKALFPAGHATSRAPESDRAPTPQTSNGRAEHRQSRTASPCKVRRDDRSRDRHADRRGPPQRSTCTATPTCCPASRKRFGRATARPRRCSSTSTATTATSWSFGTLRRPRARAAGPTAPSCRAGRCTRDRAAAAHGRAGVHQRRRSTRGAGGAILASPAVGDIDRDGSPEVVAADYEGRLYVWNATRPRRLWTGGTNLRYSGKPLRPFADVRQGKRHRTQRGFIGVAGAGRRGPQRRRQARGGSLPRWTATFTPGTTTGTPLRGFPVTVVDPVEGRVDRRRDAPASHFNAERRRRAQPGRDRRHARGRATSTGDKEAGDRRRGPTRSTRRTRPGGGEGGINASPANTASDRRARVAPHRRAVLRQLARRVRSIRSIRPRFVPGWPSQGRQDLHRAVAGGGGGHHGVAGDRAGF